MFGSKVNGNFSINRPYLLTLREKFEGEKFKGRTVVSKGKNFLSKIKLSLSKIKLSLSKRKAFKTKTISFKENKDG